jgi:DNA repair ATPase RecN
MAETKKKTETTKKKTPNKTRRSKPVTTNEESGNIVDEVKKQIESVNTEINIEYDNLENITDEIKSALEPVNEVIEETDKISEKKKELESLMSKEPDKVNNFIQEELEKAEELKEKVQKIMSSPNKTSFKGGFTTWWNGSGLDF